jgi:hypothetical protein
MAVLMGSYSHAIYYNKLSNCFNSNISRHINKERTILRIKAP